VSGNGTANGGATRGAAQTPLQRAGEAQAREYLRDLQQYRAMAARRPEFSIARDATAVRPLASGGWTTPMVVGEAEFDLDASTLSRMLPLAARDPANRLVMLNWLATCPAPWAAPVGPSVSAAPLRPPALGPVPRTELNPFVDAAIGPGNIAANTLSVLQAIDHRLGHTLFEMQSQRAMAGIVNGPDGSVRINENMKLVDENAVRRREALRQGRPIPRDALEPRYRIKVSNMRTYVTDPVGRAALRAAVAEVNRTGQFGAVQRTAVSNAMIGMDWRRGMGRLLTHKWSGGALAVANTALVDAIRSTERNARGELEFNGREFFARSLGSQMGNAAGMIGGVVVAGLFLPATATVGAVVVVSLIGGVIFQGIFGAAGVDRAVSNAARRGMGLREVRD
jgi:hypothetical protein